MKITVDAVIDAPIAAVWRAWTTPEDIMQWNAASDDWHTTRASVDLRVGGLFSSRMEAKKQQREGWQAILDRFARHVQNAR